MQSQQWMFTSPGGENEYKRPSVTREHYGAVIKTKNELVLTETEQKRRKLDCLLWKQMTEKALEQLKKRQEYFDETRKICSTYKESYGNGFKLRELGTEIGEELELKYPLYTNTAKTYFSREDNRFTGHLSNPLDAHTPVGIGHFAYI